MSDVLAVTFHGQLRDMDIMLACFVALVFAAVCARPWAKFKRNATSFYNKVKH